MSRIIVTSVTDVEEMLVRDLRSYFTTDVRFDALFPNFPSLAVTSTHPFAILMSQSVDAAIVPSSLFPCIAISDLNESVNPSGMTFMDHRGITVERAWVNMVAADRENYIISDADLSTLTTLTANSAKVPGELVKGQFRSNIALEVWADNDKVKSTLFFLLLNYFTSPRRIRVFDTYRVHLVTEAMTAEKSGVYNMDFGMLLYGSMVRLSVDYELVSFSFDTDTVLVDSIYHTVEEVHDHNG